MEANKYGLLRLVTLCELYISKGIVTHAPQYQPHIVIHLMMMSSCTVIERATRDQVAKADIDVIGLLLMAQGLFLM